MDYEYLHSVVNGAYVDLNSPKNRALPQEFRDMVQRHTFSAFKETGKTDESYSFLTMQSSSSGGVPVIAFARTAKKKKASYPCKFVQCAAWDLKDELFTEGLDKLLKTAFLSEDEIDARGAGADMAMENGSAPAATEFLDVPMDPRAVQTVLRSICLRRLLFFSPVKIAVPEEYEGRHHQYAVSVMHKLYQYMPCGMRWEAGFSTFPGPGKLDDLERIAVVFVPESAADAKTVQMNGKSPNVYQKLYQSTGLKGLDYLLDYLPSLSPEEREQLLKRIYDNDECPELVNNLPRSRLAAFDAQKYNRIGNSLRVLHLTGSPMEKVKEWQTALLDEQKEPKDKQFAPYFLEDIRAAIKNQLTETDMAAYLDMEWNARTMPEAVEASKAYQPITSIIGCNRLLWQRVSAMARPEKTGMEAVTAQRSFFTALAGKDVFDAFINGLRDKNRRQVYADIRLQLQMPDSQLRDADPMELRARHQKCIEDACSLVLEEDAERITTDLQTDLTEPQMAECLEAAKARLNLKPKTYTEYQALEDLLKAYIDCAKNAITPKLKTVLADLNQTFQKVKAEYQGSAAEREKLWESIKDKPYFEAVELVGKGLEKLSNDDCVELEQRLEGKRPADQKTYLDGYFGKFSSDSTPKTVAESRSDFIRSTVARDLAVVMESADYDNDRVEKEDVLTFITRLNMIAQILSGRDDLPKYIVMNNHQILLSELRAKLSNADLQSVINWLVMQASVDADYCNRLVEQGMLAGGTEEDYYSFYASKSSKPESGPNALANAAIRRIRAEAQNAEQLRAKDEIIQQREETLHQKETSLRRAEADLEMAKNRLEHEAQARKEAERSRDQALTDKKAAEYSLKEAQKNLAETEAERDSLRANLKRSTESGGMLVAWILCLVAVIILLVSIGVAYFLGDRTPKTAAVPTSVVSQRLNNKESNAIGIDL